MVNNTIAAISTSLSASGIGIIRISGEDAIIIADKLFVSKNNKKLIEQKTHTIHYGNIIDPESNEIVDEVLVSVMKEPNTYTKENIIEINCHGGVIVMQKILHLVLSNGARLAEPGEFTKRAFLNGRIDLSSAEAVIDIINAKTELSLESSVNQLKGNIYREIKNIRSKLIELIAHIEASIDYPEYDYEELGENMVLNNLDGIKVKVSKLLNSADDGKIIREGIKTVIVGKPNVGKSSLMNALLNEDRAIVTHVAGTTRDILEEYMNIKGIPLRIIDTAGIRETEDIVEKIGVNKSEELVEKADLVIMMLDASSDLAKEDRYIFDLIKDKKTIVLLNKIDLPVRITEESVNMEVKNARIISTSLKDNKGLDDIRKTIKDMFLIGDINFNDNLYITNIRHKVSLENAIDSLNSVKESIEMGMPEDCWSIDLKNSYDYLGEITGDSVSDDIIHQIFSQFCLGK
ncbi:tRNA uridine-5-carboxymethylaminomethyl(34) synthesis GTPase MnmE [Vallitalea sp.]|jgi:tRNA modification GTPase|uniref:tRNA uridine-5-carboxymethylaminomethyl(34) synthesis GTPase MnmE n=1 Tax=Vallitalea sp. TaxID=1882829 RepID=UPI0025E56325|nr:tRNA uridine-5-carboxymethylaminomethyl(34) synthesis GTPase MnmE [Vallitalea sp.]MCT4687686.1 tRNA uridine-5-carboxymethylaminomethyl(34) synthesis GTPase MnmE [Vallitalea sp.]